MAKKLSRLISSKRNPGQGAVRVSPGVYRRPAAGRASPAPSQAMGQAAAAAGQALGGASAAPSQALGNAAQAAGQQMGIGQFEQGQFQQPLAGGGGWSQPMQKLGGQMADQMGFQNATPRPTFSQPQMQAQQPPWEAQKMAQAQQAAQQPQQQPVAGQEWVKG